MKEILSPADFGNKAADLSAYLAKQAKAVKITDLGRETGSGSKSKPHSRQNTIRVEQNIRPVSHSKDTVHQSNHNFENNFDENLATLVAINDEGEKLTNFSPKTPPHNNQQPKICNTSIVLVSSHSNLSDLLHPQPAMQQSPRAVANGKIAKTVF